MLQCKVHKKYSHKKISALSSSTQHYLLSDNNLFAGYSITLVLFFIMYPEFVNGAVTTACTCRFSHTGAFKVVAVAVAYLYFCFQVFGACKVRHLIFFGKVSV